MNGSHREVVEKMSKTDEKILLWWSVLEERHCKCSDQYYISTSKREFPKLLLTLVILPMQQYKSQDYSAFTMQDENRPYEI